MKKAVLSLTLLLCGLTLNAKEFRFIAFADYYGGFEAEESYDSLRNRYFVQPKANLYMGPADLTISADIWAQPIGDEAFIAPENILQEAYVFFPAGPFDISLGQKRETFGFADIYSPLNVINGGYQILYSLDDPYENRRPDLMLELQFYPNFDDTLELIYIPLPRPNYEDRGTVALYGDNTDLSIDFDALPYNTESPHSLFARWYHFSSGFDLQVVYAWYTDQTPGFDFENSSVTDGVLSGFLETEYSRNHLLGAGISFPFREMIISEDIGFTITDDWTGDDIGVRNSSLTANTQFTGSILDGVFAQMNLVYQYILNYDASDLNEIAAYDLIIEELNGYHTQPQQHIAFAVLVLRKSYLRDKLALALNTAYLHPTVYIAPRAAYSLSDELRAECGIDYYTGKPNDAGLVRGYDKDNFYIRLKYEY